MKSIFTVTCIALQDGFYKGDSRCFGFFFEEQDAMKAVETNRCDIQERTYDYCVIEEYKEGIYAMPNEIQWFKHNEVLYQKTEGRGGWEKCEKPDDIPPYLCNFGLK